MQSTEEIIQNFEFMDTPIGHQIRSWENVFSSAVAELKTVEKIIRADERNRINVLPLKTEIFRAFELTKLEDVKVVIMGQDPYHQMIYYENNWIPKATGLSFSVRMQDAIPSSLSNIYKELRQSLRDFVTPDHGDLTDWARQGVLLLNSSLTVREKSPDSHGVIWHGFIKRVFSAIKAANPKCIFVLWGKKAQELKKIIGDGGIILEAAHPSGFSANRGFFGCNHFNIINEKLLQLNKTPIVWNIRKKSEKIVRDIDHGLCQISNVTSDILNSYSNIPTDKGSKDRSSLQPPRLVYGKSVVDLPPINLDCLNLSHNNDDNNKSNEESHNEETAVVIAEGIDSFPKINLEIPNVKSFPSIIIPPIVPSSIKVPMIKPHLQLPTFDDVL